MTLILKCILEINKEYHSRLVDIKNITWKYCKQGDAIYSATSVKWTNFLKDTNHQISRKNNQTSKQFYMY